MSHLIKTYKILHLDNIIMIPISQIEFTKPMISQLEILVSDENYKSYNENGINFDNLTKKDRTITLGLSRINLILEAFKNDIEFPPVKLKLEKEEIEIGSKMVEKWLPNCLKNKDNLSPTVKNKQYETKITYSVIDGRHRIVTSLFLNLTHVPAIIID
jgi:hypothetical protein